MPITKSAKKAFRKSLKKRTHNLFYKKKIKEVLKNIKNLILEKKNNEAENLLSLAYKVLDKAVKEKVIKKNTAARKKSSLARLIKNSKKPA